MFKIHKIILGVKKYCISNINNTCCLVYQKQNEIYCNNDLIITDNISNIYALNETLIYSINFQKLFYYNLKTKNLKEIKETDGFSQFISKELILVVKNSDDYSKQYLSLINLQNNQKKWTIESYFGNGIVNNNYLFASCINHRICKIDLDHPEQPLWQFDLNQLGTFTNRNGEQEAYKVIKILGIWQEELFIACNNGLILAIDSNTGIEKRKWQHIKDYYFDDEITDKIPRAESFVFDGDTLIGALNTYYFKIDLKTSEISALNISQELQKFNIFHIKTVNDNPVTDTHIFLTAMMRKKDNDPKWSYDCLIALNKKTLKIDWHYSFEEAGLGTNIPKLAGNKLYQLDNNNTLHIFEKTNNDKNL